MEREGKKCDKRKEGKDGVKRERNCNCESPTSLAGPHLQYKKAGSA